MVVASIVNDTLVGCFSKIPCRLAGEDGARSRGVLFTVVKRQSAAFGCRGASSGAAGRGWRADDAAEGFDQRRYSPPARLPVGPQPSAHRLTDRHAVRPAHGVSRRARTHLSPRRPF